MRFKEKRLHFSKKQFIFVGESYNKYFLSIKTS